MRRTILTVGITLLATTWHVPAASAQMATTHRYQLEEFQVPADQMQAFEQVAVKMVRAARQAELKSEFGWWLYQDGPRYTLVAPVGTMAQFDDPEAWMREFEETPGEATMKSAMADYGGLTARVRTSIIENSEDWVYRPENPREARYVRVMLASVKPSMHEAFDRNVRAWKAALQDVGYPYQVEVQRTLIGESGLAHVVIHHDDMAAIHGEGSVTAAFEKAGKTAEHDRLVGELMDCLSDYRWQDLTLRPELSYMPEEAGES